MESVVERPRRLNIISGEKYEVHLERERLPKIVMKYSGPTQPEKEPTLIIPGISDQPTPGVVIRTTKEDGTTIFVNLCHHSAIPCLNICRKANHPFYPDYLHLNFKQLALSEGRYLMYLGPLRKLEASDGPGFITDVVIHPTLFQELSEDKKLCNKVKIIQLCSSSFQSRFSNISFISII
jgi:hypothetical protein